MPLPWSIPAAGRHARIGVILSNAILREDDVRLVGEELGSLASGRTLWLNLSGVEFPTAGALGELVALHGELQAADGELILCNVGARAYEVFEVVGLTAILDVRPAAPNW